jgi:protein TonB
VDNFSQTVAWDNCILVGSLAELLMMLSLLMLAQAATAAPPPAAQKPPPVTIAEGAEYPKIAAENGWTGTVRVDLTISAEGTVTACKIVQSSQHRLLDDYVCTNFMRAKFTPAKDENGKPIEGHFVTPPINFKLRN